MSAQNLAPQTTPNTCSKFPTLESEPPHEPIALPDILKTKSRHVCEYLVFCIARLCYDGPNRGVLGQETTVEWVDWKEMDWMTFFRERAGLRLQSIR